jgi:hypothetical protein
MIRMAFGGLLVSCRESAPASPRVRGPAGIVKSCLNPLFAAVRKPLNHDLWFGFVPFAFASEFLGLLASLGIREDLVR